MSEILTLPTPSWVMSLKIIFKIVNYNFFAKLFSNEIINKFYSSEVNSMNQFDLFRRIEICATCKIPNNSSLVT